MAAAISADVAMVLASVVPGVLCCSSRGSPTMAAERLSSTAVLLRPRKSDGSMSWPSTWEFIRRLEDSMSRSECRLNGGSSSRATKETGKAKMGLLGFQFLLIDASIQLGSC